VIVLLHGFGESPRTWDLVRPALERHSEVRAPALPPGSEAEVLDALESAIGRELVHLVGTSLGGYLALRLAERGRARSVVALAPAGGWAVGDESWRELLAWQADAIRGLRPPPRITVNPLPDDLAAHLAVAFRRAPLAQIEAALQHGYSLDASRVTCPVRFVWGTEDELLPWPSAAARYRHEWFPHADWVVLDGVGHAPQLDVPLETAQLILDWVA
jgi:pimeloyl-ACP methyl ester carboxylesterase